jgi:GNAT superfamily N-acetyltransferase
MTVFPMINIQKLAENTFDDFVVVLSEINEKILDSATTWRLKEDFAKEQYLGFLLYEDTSLAGLAVAVSAYSAVHARKILQLDELYVRPAFRRKGLGKMLFDHVVGYARKEGYMRLEWRTAKENAEARGLYSQYETETDWVYYLMKL